jgi:diacylglycerol kinase (ATP)
MSSTPGKEVSRLVAAFRYSLAGVRVGWTQAAFRTEILAICVMTPLAFILAESGVELALLLGSLWLVCIVELLNTGVEKAIDRISAERHELSKQAKDVASAAVLLSIGNAITVWLAVWWW